MTNLATWLGRYKYSWLRGDGGEFYALDTGVLMGDPFS